MDFEVTISTGTTALLSPEVREDLDSLIEELRTEGFDGHVAERPPAAAGVTWVEIFEFWLAAKAGETLYGWMLEEALDKLAAKVKVWARDRHRRHKSDGHDSGGRPQSMTIKSLGNEPLRRIDVDADGNVHEYRWVEVGSEGQVQERDEGGEGTPNR